MVLAYTTTEQNDKKKQGKYLDQLPKILQKQNGIYTLLVIVFIRNSFKEHLHTVSNKTLWLSSCLAKSQLHSVQKFARL